MTGSDGYELLWFALSLCQGGLMLYAAWHDARTRTFPNALAFAFALVCAMRAVVEGGYHPELATAVAGDLEPGAFLLSDGLKALEGHAVAAAVVFGMLFAFELAWRHARRDAGLGMGDAKFLFGLMLVRPLAALLAFAGGLLLMAVAGLVLRRRALPVLPFVVGAYGVVLVSMLAVPPTLPSIGL